MTEQIKILKDFIRWIVYQRDNLYYSRTIDSIHKEKFLKMKFAVQEVKEAIKHVKDIFELSQYNFNDSFINTLINNYIKDKKIVKSDNTSEEKSTGDPEKEDPEIVFKKMNKYTEMVIKGYNPSLIICGAPGVGKTFRVKKALRENGYIEDRNLRTIKGKCAARILYSTLYEYQDKGDIVLIDDADGLIGPHAPEDCINILKAALDSETDEDGGRLITYGVTGKILDSDGQEIPKRFNFKGAVIVLTNWNVNSLDSAVKGRSFIQDINFDNDQMLQIIKKLMPAIDTDHLSMKSKFKAFEYLKEMANSNEEMEISIRTFAICAKMFEATKNDPNFSDNEIRMMINEQMKLQARKRKGKAEKY